MREFVADFETTTVEDDCRVWLWGLCVVNEHPLPSDVLTGIDIVSFVRKLCNVRSSVVWFHNLKFDGMFILDYLLRNGYEWVSVNPNPGEFSTLIDKTSKFYMITVQWKNGAKTEFRDSLKRIPISVESMASAYGAKVSKLHIDHKDERPVGYKPDQHELDYVIADVLIVAHSLAVQRSQGMRKITVGSDSLADYKKMVGKFYNKHFPVLDIELDGFIRRAYRGGWTYVNRKIAKEVVGPGRVYDVNSLYPYVMRTCPLPYGEPTTYFGDPTKLDVLWIGEVEFSAAIKPSHLPTIQLKNSRGFTDSEYVDVVENVTMVVTSVDWKLWCDHYNITVIAWHSVLVFDSKRGLFDAFIDKWSEVKMNSKGGVREIAKLFLNSLYGKTASNPDVTGRRPVMVNNRVKLVLNDEEYKDPIYTAAGAFITSYARNHTIRAAQQNFDSFAYADTDSLHLLIPPDNHPDTLPIDPTELGKWKHEHDFDYAVFWRPKTYSERVPSRHSPMGGTHYETHIAGLPRTRAAEIRLADFEEGAVFSGKLLPRVTQGGIVLVEADFSLRT